MGGPGNKAPKINIPMPRVEGTLDDLGRNIGNEGRALLGNVSRESAAAGDRLGLDDTMTQILFPGSIPEVARRNKEKAENKNAMEGAERARQEAAQPEIDRIRLVTNFLNAFGKQRKGTPGRQQLLLGKTEGGPLLTPMGE